MESVHTVIYRVLQEPWHTANVSLLLVEVYVLYAREQKRERRPYQGDSFRFQKWHNLPHPLAT